ncbi:hypothetical protein NMD21_19415 [Citrobacter portucalensis]|uniref:hypothetical protein n=1 Tax=Citrobacter TaxID=544 RepID=UPI0025764E05|nr:hypothetical protein [Citrobacter sp. Cpo090]MDM2844202.1 hypothetical protein [Citrobacter sp. Cpo090]
MVVILDEKIARYEDSHQIHSVSIIDFYLKTTMKKLEHNLYITINGPDEDKAKSCFYQALQAGLITGVAAAFIGAGVGAAELGFTVAKKTMLDCMGNEFEIRLRDESHWVYWEV